MLLIESNASVVERIHVDGAPACCAPLFSKVGWPLFASFGHMGRIGRIGGEITGTPFLWNIVGETSWIGEGPLLPLFA